MTLFQAVVVALTALIVTPGLSFYFDVTPKLAVVLVGTAGALIFARRGGPVAGLRTFTMLLLLNALSVAVSTALSVRPALSTFGTNWRRFGLVAQLAVLLFAWLVARECAGRPDRVRTILRVVAGAGTLTAIYGIAQYFGWDPILPAAGYHIGEGVWTIVRPPGTLGYVSYFGIWLVMAAGLSATLAVMETDGRRRLLAGAATALAIIAMLLSGTRAAMVAMVAGAAVWYYRTGLRPSRRVLAGCAVVVATAAAFYFSPLGLQLRSRTRWFVEDPWGGARPALWRDSLGMAMHRLPLGYGPEVFTAVFPRFESVTLARAYPDFAHESAHSIFLDALVAQGIPGFLLLAALCWAGLRGGGGAAGTGLAATLAAAIVAQQFSVFTIPTALTFYLVIALSVALPARTAVPIRVQRHLPLRLAGAPVALALVYVAARGVMADRALAMTREALDEKALPSAAAQYGRHLRLRLPGTTADLWYSRALLVFASSTPDPAMRFYAIAQSGVAGLEATRTAEDPFNAWYNMALLHASQNDAAGTEKSLRQAIAAHPNWFKPHWTLAQLLIRENRRVEAEKEAAVAADLNGGKNPEVSQTLASLRGR